MLPSRISLGIVGLSLAAGVYSWIFDDIPSLIITITLLSILAIRGFVFLISARAVVKSFTVNRNSQKRYFRQGSSTEVRTEIKIQLPYALSVTVRDIPPAAAIIQHGSPEMKISGTGICTGQIKYAISVLTAGEVTYLGTRLIIEDPFYHISLNFHGASHRKPTFLIEPSSRIERTKSALQKADLEVEKVSSQKGYSIIAFRDYTPGDDARAIDWKLSAKHGKIFVREYAGLSDSPLLFIVDLPQGPPNPDDTSCNRMLGALFSGLQNTEKENRSFSLLLVCGPNLLRYIPHEQSFTRIWKVLAEFQNPQRFRNCYRYLDERRAKIIAAKIRKSLQCDNISRDFEYFLSQLSTLYLGIKPGTKKTPFELQVARVISGRHRESAYLFSTFSGDLSHLGMIIHQLRWDGKGVICEIPRDVASPSLLQNLRNYGATELKVIA